MGTKITGLEGKTLGQISDEIDEGARFVYYTFTISIIVMTFKRSSAIHYLAPGASPVVKGLPYTLLSLVAGWWGIPWGPIYTIGSLATNLGGGKDVTAEVLEDLHASAAHAHARSTIAPAPLDDAVPAQA